LVEVVDRSGYDSLWVGDHVSFAVPILDPLLQLARAAVVSRRLTLGSAYAAAACDSTPPSSGYRVVPPTCSTRSAGPSKPSNSASGTAASPSVQRRPLSGSNR
jgi:hypothetical protein